MKTFKEYLASDRNTFLNPEEYGDLFKINGTVMTAVLDQTADTEHPWAAEEGVSMISHTLYVSLAEFGEEPKQDEMIFINDRRYRIARVDANMGMLSLGLEAYVT
ncbi:hypothetical protein [Paenibacillus piscarius]|uniref:hypothetical protein n=1 Tax=Paenibacillus piscarius TaxID=1089681 RepID=UPI001EE90FDE|nr:hypothetical protein [Paenibacillus piscarius]